LEIVTLMTAGFEPAIEAMRNPMNSWDKSDSFVIRAMVDPEEHYEVGVKDKELSKKLQTAGPEHCKHLRMVMVWADITAPRQWWMEFDTYRHGVEKVSCSTMHKLMARPLRMDDFEHEPGCEPMLDSIIRELNRKMYEYQNAIDVDTDRAKEVWREIILLLPQSYLQKRTVMMSYAALRNIVRQRKGHKLKEWAMFIDWAKSLPESWMIFD